MSKLTGKDELLTSLVVVFREKFEVWHVYMKIMEAFRGRR